MLTPEEKAKEIIVSFIEVIAKYDKEVGAYANPTAGFKCAKELAILHVQGIKNEIDHNLQGFLSTDRDAYYEQVIEHINKF